MKKMKIRFMPLLLAIALFTQSNYAVTVMKSSDSTQSIQQLVNQFKDDIYVKKVDAEKSLNNLTTAILDKNFTISDLQLYVQMNATAKESAKFNQLLILALEDAKDLKNISASELSFILKNAMNATSESGAHFMSCGVGLGVGIPLLALGVIIGVIALVNATASKELVTQEYINKRSDANTNYLNTKADLELEKSRYQSDIIYYQDEIKELNRKIGTGNFTAAEIEKMKLDIHQYEFYISDKVALIGEVQVDIDYYNAKYDSDMTTLNQQEISQRAGVDEKHNSAGKQAIVAGITSALGAAFVLSGVNDCN